MSETTEFTIGSEVACSDGVCGELTRVVVDPVARALTLKGTYNCGGTI